MTNRLFRLPPTLTVVAAFAVVPTFAQSVIYVDQAATGANVGTSWTNAYVYLQDALQASQTGDEIWVAAGTYRPDQGATVTLGDREASFEIPDGVSLYGGFNGTEVNRSERDWEVNTTILSGDIQDNDDTLLSLENPLLADNSYNILRIEGGRSYETVVDGFVIRDGMANELGHQGGSGIIARWYAPAGSGGGVRIARCVLTQNGG